MKSGIQWLRENLFSGWANTAATLLILFVVWKTVPPFIDWAFLDAVWKPDSKACRASEGACWGFIAEKHRFILFGTYPYELHWRPAVATLILIGLWIFSAFRATWRPWLALVWFFGLTAIGILMWGGILGLRYVENEKWGGLILTLLLSTFGIAFAFPLSILLALGRRSDMPAIRALSVGYIELVRGVPLISMILFAAAYLAEVVRGGLQAIPKGQYDAAHALALPYWRRTYLIILPQALRISVPPLVNTFIGFFKDTSLVLIIGLFDLLSTVKISLNEPAWTGFGVEAYLAVSLVYFVFCAAMSRYSRGLEYQGQRR